MKYKIAVLALALGIVSNTASAAVIINIDENAGNVEGSLSGSVNLAATLGFGGIASNTDQFVVGNGGNVAFGDSVQSHYYRVNLSWTDTGNSISGQWSASSGDRVVLFAGRTIGVPIGYVSGDALSATAVSFGATYASLGLSIGSFVTTFSNGAFSDSVTVNIGQRSSVPEPSSLALLSLGLVGFRFARRRRTCPF